MGGPFCVLKGGPAERIGASFVLAAYILADIAFAFAHPHLPIVVEFAIDFGLAISLLAVALRYTNLWLGGAMLVQSFNLCFESIWLDGDGTSSSATDVVTNCLSAAMMTCIFAGAIASWRKRIKLRQAAKPANTFMSSIPA